MLHYSISFFLSTLSSASFGNCFLPILHYNSATPGRMQVDCGSWIRWLVCRVRSCADKPGDGWKKESTANGQLYDDDGHSNDVGFRLLLFVADIMAARAFPPQNEQTSNGNEKRHGAKINTRSSAPFNDTELHERQ